jgi:hypothetical protein
VLTGVSVDNYYTHEGELVLQVRKPHSAKRSLPPPRS